MTVQTTFKRYEIKYLMTKQQKEELVRIMQPYMKLDSYGHSTIRNIYFDTPDYRLIRRSLEKPAYKEKLRIRSYKPVQPNDPVFIELKKKYDSVVYKRRLTLEDEQARISFEQDMPLPVNSQIADEIAYFREYYGELKPAVFLTYEREAFYDLKGSEFRVTFDENILYRDHDFSLGSEVYGTPILNDNMCLMEIKTAGGLPLWMVDAMNQLGLVRTSFSKYGTAYQQMMLSNQLFNNPVMETNPAIIHSANRPMIHNERGLIYA